MALGKSNDVGIRAVWDNKDFAKGQKAYQTGLKNATSATKNSTTQMSAAGKETAALGNIWKVAGAAIGVYSVGMIAKGGIELAKLGAQSMRMRTSFQELARQAGASGDEILKSLQDSSRGTVDNTSLMLSANRAMMLGLGADAEQLGKLMQVAAFRGKAMGLSVQQAFSDMTTGIGRKSIMILDNLGIVGLKMGETTTQADIMAQVIDQGMKQIEAAGGVVGDEAESFERMNAAITNVKTALGELLAPTVASGAQAIADSINVWTKNFEMLGQILDEIGQISTGPTSEQVTMLTIWSPEAASKMQALVTQTGSMKTATDAMAQSIADATSATQELSRSDQALLDLVTGLNLGWDLQSGKIDTYNDLMRNMKPMIDITVKSLEDEWVVRRRLDKAKLAGILSLKEYRAAILHVKYQVVNLRDEESRAAEAADNAAFAAGRLASMQRQVAEATLLAADAMRESNQALYEGQRAARGYVSAFDAAVAARALRGGATGYVPMGTTKAELTELYRWKKENEYDAIKDAADEFRGKMEGANNIIAADISTKVHDALGLGAPTGDQPAEPARRLLDVANLGEGSPWAEGMRQSVANAWESLRPGEGIGAKILGDEGALKTYSDKLYTMIADPRMGAGLLTQLETATGDEWVDHLALANELAIQQGITDFVASGWEEVKLRLPAELVPAGPEGGETWTAEGESVGGELKDGINTVLAMKGGKTPLEPLETDLKDVVTQITEFRDIWDNLNDKTLSLLIDVEYGGGGGGGGSGNSSGDYEYKGPPISELPWTPIFKRGGDFIVPPGYANDSFPMLVSSHERVTVQTPAQQASGGRTISIGPNYINNGMDLQTFDSHVRNVVGGDLQ